MPHCCRLSTVKSHCLNGHPYPESLRSVGNGCAVCPQERRAQKAASKTHCEKGHELKPENTTVDIRGRRICRTCMWDRTAGKTECLRGHPYEGNRDKYGCIICAREKSLEWNHTNPERVKANDAARYYADPDKARERSAAYRRDNPDKWRETVKAWRHANRERYNAYARLRKATRPGSKSLPIEERQVSIDWARIVTDDPCSYCGAPHEHLDHIVPVINGGTGAWTNLTSACAQCNIRKGSSPLLTFLVSYPLGTASGG